MIRRPKSDAPGARPERSTVATLRDARRDVATAADRLAHGDTGEMRVSVRLAETAALLDSIAAELARTGHR